MVQYQLKIELLSDALIGSGEGYGAIIDSDVVFDDVGIPFIPGKRIKGCLRDSMNKVSYMIESSGLLKSNKSSHGFQILEELFGSPGEMYSSPLYISNFFIDNYKENRKVLKYLHKKYPKIITEESIVDHFCEIRQKTAIEETTGTAKPHSLRSLRVLKKGLSFRGKIELMESNLYFKKLIALSCFNLRRIGTERNRGLGEIECKLFHNNKEVTVESILGER
ncbi:MAG: RAMP superfamily CRISPR-associated protein [Elusimicrobiota bacterium]